MRRKEQTNRKRRLLDGEGEATWTMLACSEPPEGRAQWTLQLLAERLVTLDVVEEISRSTVHKVFKKTLSSPG